MELTNGALNMENGYDGLYASLAFGIGLSFIPASLIVFVITEKVQGAKSSQLVSGVSVYTYWLSNFIFDYFCKYFFVAISCCLLVLIF